MNEILTIAFVLAATAFFKQQFGLSGKGALLCAFLISLFVGLAPLIGSLLPAAAPFVDVLIKVVVLFIGAAGAYDAFVDLKTKGQVG